MTHQDVLENEIKTILSKVAPNAYYDVAYKTAALGEKYIKISIAASAYEINGISGQYPAHVSLVLFTDTMELQPQIFGGMGGQSIHRMPRKDDPKEIYLALKSVKISFRKPKPEKVSVLKAIERFALRWKQVVADHLEEMPYQEHVDYRKAVS